MLTSITFQSTNMFHRKSLSPATYLTSLHIQRQSNFFNGAMLNINSTSSLADISISIFPPKTTSPGAWTWCLSRSVMIGGRLRPVDCQLTDASDQCNLTTIANALDSQQSRHKCEATLWQVNCSQLQFVAIQPTDMQFVYLISSFNSARFDFRLWSFRQH